MCVRTRSAKLAELKLALQRAANALQLAVDETAVERLLAYLALLQKWNKVYNLTAVRDEHAMLSHHLYDCMATVKPVRLKLALSPSVSAQPKSSIPVLDVGAGAGLPGVVLAICEPRLQICCIDAVEKKTAFLRQVIAELQLPNLQAVHGRVEKHHAVYPSSKFALITARAFSSLAQFVELTAPLLAEEGHWMAMKARDPASEIAELPSSIDVFHVEHLAVPELDAARCLVWMKQRG